MIPVMTPFDMAAACDDRTTLTASLDRARAMVRERCADLSEDEARRAPLPGYPLMTISGLVSHLRWVEYSWLRVEMLGEPDYGPRTEREPDRDLHIALEIPLSVLLDEYQRQCSRHRALVASMDLATRAAAGRTAGHHVTLRWILHHLVEETARHVGHLDVLRAVLPPPASTVDHRVRYVEAASPWRKLRDQPGEGMPLLGV